jgi:hypothetical protein
MIELVFTLDYEIYGNGTGPLKDLVYEPGQRLREIFRRWDARFVAFIEAAEFEQIEAQQADPAIALVKGQIRDFHREGFEIGLHLHPQWCNAHFEQGQWRLDYSEYNLCTLPRPRIESIVQGALAYLRQVLGQPDFTPLSFRAGNWLFQPTATAASVLAANGIKIDSSVFKGGVQHNHRLDYRRALRNGYYWPFHSDATVPDPSGPWTEVPIHVEMVAPWKMATGKRVSMGNSFGAARRSRRQKWNRIRDFLRLKYPLKLDFCRMTLHELATMVENVMREDCGQPGVYRPLVAIGHTKDLTDPKTVDEFLCFLRSNQIAVSTFEAMYPRLLGSRADMAAEPKPHAVAAH